MRLEKEDLLTLYQRSRDEERLYLELCHKYFIFYVGLLSAILVAAITAFLRLEPKPTGLLLVSLIPIVNIPLAWLGHRTIKVFFQRAIAAWITGMNLEQIIGLGGTDIIPIGAELRFPGKTGGLLPSHERKEIHEILDSASSAEEVLEAVSRKGISLRYSKWVLFIYAGLSLLLMIFISASSQS